MYHERSEWFQLHILATYIDPCIDGIMNYKETDIDCGGSLCPPCSANQVKLQDQQLHMLWLQNRQLNCWEC